VVALLIIFGLFFLPEPVYAQADPPPEMYPQANCGGINIADRRFLSLPLSGWWGSGRPPVDYDAYTTRMWKGNVQELVYAQSDVWVRTGSGRDAESLRGKAWQRYPLSSVWGGHTNPPPFTGISSASYSISNGKFSEVIISGNKVWYRSTQTSGAYDFPTVWNSKLLSEAWGGTTNPPGFGSVDERSLRVVNGKIEELVVQGGMLYRRIGTGVDINTLPGVWTNYVIANIWKNVPDVPTVTPGTLNYQFSGNKLREVVILNGNYYYRDCRGYPESVYDSALRMIDTFLYYYSDTTNYEALVNANYDNSLMGSEAFRSLMANAVAHTARYQIYHQTVDKDKALYYFGATLANFGKWKEVWLSGIGTRDFLLVAWYWWNNLSTTQRAETKAVAITQANYFMNIIKRAIDAYQRGDLTSADYKTVSGYINDTKAEENGASAEALSFIGQLFADDPQSLLWEYYARCYAYHTITPSSDGQKCFIDTQTVYDDFTLDNHNYHPSPVYTLAAIASLQQGELAYHLNGVANPPEFRHNITNLWQNFHNYYYTYPADPPGNSFKIKPEYNPGADWGDTHVSLAMTEFSYTGLFGGGNSGANFTNLETYAVIFFDDWWYRNFTRYNEPAVVSSMPKYNGSGVTLRWFGNGLSHGKGAGEIVLYHELSDSKLNLRQVPSSADRIKNIIRNFTRNTTASFYDANADETVNSIDLEAFR